MFDIQFNQIPCINGHTDNAHRHNSWVSGFEKKIKGNLGCDPKNMYPQLANTEPDRFFFFFTVRDAFRNKA